MFRDTDFEILQYNSNPLTIKHMHTFVNTDRIPAKDA
jgi:hypothetical protein